MSLRDFRFLINTSTSCDMEEVRDCEEDLTKDHIGTWMPREGMQLSTEEEAHEFYNEYAKRTRFGIRTESSKRSTAYGPVDRKYFVCYKVGRKRAYLGGN
ncbi:hypothetical protein SLA2020_113710 [Shorea laevis]